MAPVWSCSAAAAALVAMVLFGSTTALPPDGDGFTYGVLAYPAGEARISRTCFSLGPGDPFTCGWYCAHAFFMETDIYNGQVAWTSFGEGNDADNAQCSDCSLFEGFGRAPDLMVAGNVAEGMLDGGYKWSAYYDEANQEMMVNFTDYMEPCEIKYIVTEGEVMGVLAAEGRPAKANTQATLKKVAHGGWKACDDVQVECMNWHVYVEGDVADWESLDEHTAEMVCPARITILGMSNGEYMGHEATPRGVDSWETQDGGHIVSDRNTLISWQPVNLTKCEFFYEVTEGCWNEVGPDCHGQARVAHEASLPTIPERIAAVKARRLAKKQARGHNDKKNKVVAGQLPIAKPRHVTEAAYHAAMAHDGDFADPQSSWWQQVVASGSAASFAGWALAAVLIAAWAVRRGSCRRDGYKALPAHSETSPLVMHA